jgi:hypothetical protein
VVVRNLKTGIPVEICVVAGAKAGATLVARYSVGVVFDEFTRMVGREEGVVNVDEAIDAVESRLLPGAQVVEIGSPWAPWGPAYDKVTANEGHPTPEMVVIRARGDLLNPTWWTKARAEKLRIRCEKTGSPAYRTDFLAEFADQEEALIASALIDAACRDQLRIAWEKGHDYAAAVDPATRTNAWPLLIADRVGRKKRIVAAREWVPGATPLRPLEGLTEFGEEQRGYNLTDAYTDQLGGDFIVDLAAQCATVTSRRRSTCSLTS